MINTYFITAKTPFRFFALIIILFLFTTTLILSYKSFIEMIDFFHLKHGTDKAYISFLISTLIAIATIVQSAPVIWDKLGYWGQLVDNYILFILTHKKYFLDEVEITLKDIRKIINQANAEFQRHLWARSLKNENNNENDIYKDIHDLLVNAIVKYHAVIDLLKHNEAFDTINIERKNAADQLLNSFIVQTTEILIKISK